MTDKFSTRYLDTEMATDQEVSDLLSTKQSVSEKNQANGYAGLNSSGLVPESRLEPVFGRNYAYFVDSVPFTTSSNNNQNACNFLFSIDQSGTYRLNLQWNFTLNSTSNSAFFEMYVDNVLSNKSIQVEIKDTTDDITYSMFQIIDLTQGNHTLQLRTRTESNTQVTISVIKFDLWRVS